MIKFTSMPVCMLLMMCGKLLKQKLNVRKTQSPEGNFQSEFGIRWTSPLGWPLICRLCFISKLLHAKGKALRTCIPYKNSSFYLTSKDTTRCVEKRYHGIHCLDTFFVCHNTEIRVYDMVPKAMSEQLIIT